MPGDRGDRGDRAVGLGVPTLHVRNQSHVLRLTAVRLGVSSQAQGIVCSSVLDTHSAHSSQVRAQRAIRSRRVATPGNFRLSCAWPTSGSHEWRGRAIAGG